MVRTRFTIWYYKPVLHVPLKDQNLMELNVYLALPLHFGISASTIVQTVQEEESITIKELSAYAPMKTHFTMDQNALNAIILNILIMKL